jgi:hypothetical protein
LSHLSIFERGLDFLVVILVGVVEDDVNVWGVVEEVLGTDEADDADDAADVADAGDVSLYWDVTVLEAACV